MDDGVDEEGVLSGVDEEEGGVVVMVVSVEVDEGGVSGGEVG